MYGNWNIFFPLEPVALAMSQYFTCSVIANICIPCISRTSTMHFSIILLQFSVMEDFCTFLYILYWPAGAREMNTNHYSSRVHPLWPHCPEYRLKANKLSSQPARNKLSLYVMEILLAPLWLSSSGFVFYKIQENWNVGRVFLNFFNIYFYKIW